MAIRRGHDVGEKKQIEIQRQIERCGRIGSEGEGITHVGQQTVSRLTGNSEGG
jgi:hypothetical protein